MSLSDSNLAECFDFSEEYLQIGIGSLVNFINHIHIHRVTHLILMQLKSWVACKFAEFVNEYNNRILINMEFLKLYINTILRIPPMYAKGSLHQLVENYCSANKICWKLKAN